MTSPGGVELTPPEQKDLDKVVRANLLSSVLMTVSVSVHQVSVHEGRPGHHPVPAGRQTGSSL